MSADGFGSVEANISRAGAKWKWLQFLQKLGVLGTTVTLLLLLVGVAMHLQWVRSTLIARSLWALILCGGFIGLAVIFISTVAAILDRRWLAKNIEQSQPGLQDRLNTLIALERVRPNPASPLPWFRRRIFHQANFVLATHPPSVRFPTARPLLCLAAFLGAIVGTSSFYTHYDPWRHVSDIESDMSAKSKEDKPVNLALPDTNALEEKKPWGEVRITDPGRDLKITKVDAVQLQIEAAASSPLTSNAWYSTVNGAGDQLHLLPQVTDPKCAIYQPIIYADEFQLKDWDVMTYYARTWTDRGEKYGSDIYFLEVRPFREDILKMPGGENGDPYKALSQLTDLIDRQQHVIRQTHKHVQSPPDSDRLQQQDRGKLADAERDLSTAARHLYAELATKMENKPIGLVLDQLSQAEKTLAKAEGTLRQGDLPMAQEDERTALRQLIETRKIFQKTVSDHPDDFKDKEKNDDVSPIAEDGKGKLKEMAEFRNEEKATQDFMENLVKKQQSVTDRAHELGARSAKLGKEQREIKKELEEFKSLHPQMFTHATNELAQASDAMEQSASDIEKRDSNLRKPSDQAAKKLENLRDAVNDEMAGRQLTSAYKLKKLLDQQIKNLENVEKQPGTPTQEQLQQTADQAKATTDQLQKLAAQKPTSELFGPELADSLKGDKKQGLDSKLDQLGQATSNAARQTLARESKEALQGVSKAFDQSQPQMVRQSKQRDALKDGDQSSMEKGLAQLQSMLNRLQNNHPLSAQDLKKMSQETLENLQKGVQESYGSNENAKKLLLLLDEELKEEGHKIDIEGLKKLMAQLENFSAEIKDASQQTNETAVTHIDAAKLPAAYRGRIQEYFRKLSEAK